MQKNITREELEEKVFFLYEKKKWGPRSIAGLLGVYGLDLEAVKKILRKKYPYREIQNRITSHAYADRSTARVGSLVHVPGFTIKDNYKEW